MTSILYIPLIIILGLEGSLIILILFIQIFTFLSLHWEIQTIQCNNKFPNYIIIIWCFFTLQYFFSTGHTFNFNSIHWAAGNNNSFTLKKLKFY